MSSPHLDAVDPQAWPEIATIPTPGSRWRSARNQLARAEAVLAQTCAQAGIELDGSDPDVTVAHDALFARIAARGWVGLAEGYLAGEWETPDSDRLVGVLAKLISAGYSPATPSVGAQDHDGVEWPHELVKLYAGDGISHQGGIYATGVATTMRTQFPPVSSNKAKGTSATFIDQTTVSTPTSVDREDLESAQNRAAQRITDSAQVGPGSQVLVFPATGAAAAAEAARKRAVVDVLTADPAAMSHLKDYFFLEGVGDNVHCQVIPEPIPTNKHWKGRYDAVISIELLEKLSKGQRVAYAHTLERFLGMNGRLSLQSIIRQAEFPPAAALALEGLRAYLLPALNFPSAEDVHKLFNSHTNVRITGQTHTGAHYQESLAQQRSFFEGHLREAAAAGFDPVYRRLWIYQFALIEALFSIDALDCVQFCAVLRHRNGRR